MSDNPLKGPTPADFFNWVGQYVQPMMENSLKMMSQMSANLQTPLPQSPPPPLAATPPSTDPLAVWRSFYDQNEQTWTKFMQQFVGTPEFAAGLGTVASQQAILQNNIRQTALSYLKAAHMPSQEDITRVAALVVALDAKIDDLQDSWGDFLDGLPGANVAERATKSAIQPPDERLTALENRLAAIETKLDRLLETLEPQSQPEKVNQTPSESTVKPASRNRNRQNGAQAVKTEA